MKSPYHSRGLLSPWFPLSIPTLQSSRKRDQIKLLWFVFTLWSDLFLNGIPVALSSLYLFKFRYVIICGGLTRYITHINSLSWPIFGFIGTSLFPGVLNERLTLPFVKENKLTDSFDLTHSKWGVLGFKNFKNFKNMLTLCSQKAFWKVRSSHSV